MIPEEDKARLITNHTLAKALQIYKDDPYSGSHVYNQTQIQAEIEKHREASLNMAARIGAQSLPNSPGATLLSSNENQTSRHTERVKSSSQQEYCYGTKDSFSQHNLTNTVCQMDKQKATGLKLKVRGHTQDVRVDKAAELRKSLFSHQNSTRTAALGNLQENCAIAEESSHDERLHMSGTRDIDPEGITTISLPEFTQKARRRSFDDSIEDQTNFSPECEADIDIEFTDNVNTRENVSNLVINSNDLPSEQLADCDEHLGSFDTCFLKLSREGVLRQGAFGSSRQVMRQNSLADNNSIFSSVVEPYEYQCSSRKTFVRLQSTPKLFNSGGVRNEQLSSSMKTLDEQTVIRDDQCMTSSFTVNRDIDLISPDIPGLTDPDLKTKVRDDNIADQHCSAELPSAHTREKPSTVPITEVQRVPMSQHREQTDPLSPREVDCPQAKSYNAARRHSTHVKADNPPRCRVHTFPTSSFLYTKMQSRNSFFTHSKEAEKTQNNFPQTVSSVLRIWDVETNASTKRYLQSCAPGSHRDTMSLSRNESEKFEQVQAISSSLSEEDSVLRIWGIDKAIKRWKKKAQRNREMEKLEQHIKGKDNLTPPGKTFTKVSGRTDNSSCKSTASQFESNVDTSETNFAAERKEREEKSVTKRSAPDSLAGNMHALVRKWIQKNKSGRSWQLAQDISLSQSDAAMDVNSGCCLPRSVHAGQRDRCTHAIQSLIMTANLRVVQVQLNSEDAPRPGEKAMNATEIVQNIIKTRPKCVSIGNEERDRSSETSYFCQNKVTTKLMKTVDSDEHVVSLDVLSPSASEKSNPHLKLHVQFKHTETIQSDLIHHNSRDERSPEDVSKDKPQGEARSSYSPDCQAKRRLSRCLYGVSPTSDEVFFSPQTFMESQDTVARSMPINSDHKIKTESEIVGCYLIKPKAIARGQSTTKHDAAQHPVGRGQLKNETDAEYAPLPQSLHPTDTPLEPPGFSKPDGDNGKERDAICQACDISFGQLDKAAPSQNVGLLQHTHDVDYDTESKAQTHVEKELSCCMETVISSRCRDNLKGAIAPHSLIQLSETDKLNASKLPTVRFATPEIKLEQDESNDEISRPNARNQYVRKDSDRATPYSRPRWAALSRLKLRLTSLNKDATLTSVHHDISDGTRDTSKLENLEKTADVSYFHHIRRTQLDIVTRSLGKLSPRLRGRQNPTQSLASLWVPGIVSCAQALIGSNSEILTSISPLVSKKFIFGNDTLQPESVEEGSSQGLSRPRHPRIHQLKKDCGERLGNDFWPATTATSDAEQEQSTQLLQPELPTSQVTQSQVKAKTGPPPQTQPKLHAKTGSPPQMQPKSHLWPARILQEKQRQLKGQTKLEKQVDPLPQTCSQVNSRPQKEIQIQPQPQIQLVTQIQPQFHIQLPTQIQQQPQIQQSNQLHSPPQREIQPKLQSLKFSSIQMQPQPSKQAQLGQRAVPQTIPRKTNPLELQLQSQSEPSEARLSRGQQREVEQQLPDHVSLEGEKALEQMPLQCHEPQAPLINSVDHSLALEQVKSFPQLPQVDAQSRSRDMLAARPQVTAIIHTESAMASHKQSPQPIHTQGTGSGPTADAINTSGISGLCCLSCLRRRRNHEI
ncbi:hypothetical protein PoB_004507400 [Plakobranchus ocellatus]|uniref:Uncharacterized protein n=1 Tax=Plakobranchus ocellatus TaxID=259542 RepID=A0AAV4BJT0_9GAST|nr:hypothetical protein PoB_004507400 [Plakobranchus ocellatus]